MTETSPHRHDPAQSPVPPPDAPPDEHHVDLRSELLPEEVAAGSDDPTGQAEAVLVESEERTEHPDPDDSSQSGRRRSADTAEP